jgi:hypothetical protein
VRAGLHLSTDASADCSNDLLGCNGLRTTTRSPAGLMMPDCSLRSPAVIEAPSAPRKLQSAPLETRRSKSLQSKTLPSRHGPLAFLPALIAPTLDQSTRVLQEAAILAPSLRRYLHSPAARWRSPDGFSSESRVAVFAPRTDGRRSTLPRMLISPAIHPASTSSPLQSHNRMIVNSPFDDLVQRSSCTLT